ncbi:hypothetical protein Mgra_00005530 [Meloidogyne graminicola]|uniref:MFS domain-containing protein n=1 Tax=Meloidogyne graminicola TaxID=189291 RepID=A0A8S9ZPL5_9BILA|nr:hypothetical protein Mgra_00005530 [Meloidogyne graminicola]
MMNHSDNFLREKTATGKKIPPVVWQTTLTPEKEGKKNIFIKQQKQQHIENKITIKKQINTLNITKREEKNIKTTTNNYFKNEKVLEEFWNELEENNKIEENNEEKKEEEERVKQINLNKIENIRQKRQIKKDEEVEGFLFEPVDNSFPWAQEKIRLLAQSLLFSSPGIAIMILHFPFYFILRRFGSHLPIFVVLLISSIITGLFPYIINLSKYSPFPFVLFFRILLGICFSPAFSFFGQMSAQWSSVGEQQFFILTGFLAILFGPTISWFISISFLSFDKNSQILVYGIHGVFGILLSFIWLFLYRDNPQIHKLVNGEELHYIVKKKPRQKHLILQQNLPNSLLCLLIRSTSAWAIWIASFCFFFAILTLLIFYPIFLHKIMKQTLNKELLIIPFILLFLILLFSHLIYSIIIYKNKLLNNQNTTTLIVRIFNTIGFSFSSIIFLLIAMLPGSIEDGEENIQQQQPFIIKWRYILISISLFPLGFCSLGFIKSSVASGGIHFTQYIISHIQIPFGLAYSLIPIILFSNISSSSLFVHWRLLFLCCALLLILGLAIFAILGRGLNI